MKIQHYLPSRKWCRSQAPLIMRMSQHPKLRTDNTRLWEYPFVYTLLKEKIDRGSSIIDIGAGDAAFSKFLIATEMHNVTCVDNYDEGSWGDMKAASKDIDMKVVDNDCTDLTAFENEKFDVALLISVLEHVPTNMIFDQYTGELKKGHAVHSEYPIRKKVISEALRVTKKGGLVVVTTDLYLDWLNEMNLSFYTLLGYGGVERDDIMKLDPNILHDLYVVDNPIHKGRLLPICVTVEKELKD
tara:strand:- start:2769 stop:3497 length:729 start_codon:yes stop_codon:yes gene_type:complete